MTRAAKLTLVLLFLSAAEGHAAGLPLDPSTFSNPQAVIDRYAAVFVKTIGLMADHRDFEPATPLGVSIGLDLSVEVSLVKVPQDFNDTMASLGLSSSIPILPVPRINVHKSLGPRMDLGGSFIKYLNYLLYGGSLKVVVWQGEEGLTWAIRGTFNKANMGIVHTTGYGAQLLTSRQLDFADPYIGIGYQTVTGTLSFDGIPNPSNPLTTMTLTGTGSGSAFLSFIGVGFKVPNLGLKLTIQGEYSSADAHSIGTKVGFSF